MLAILAASILFPPLKYRWVYVQTNFYRPEAVAETLQLVERAAKVGYNGMVFCDTKLQSQDPYPDFYRKAIRLLIDAAEKNHFDLVPGILPVGYADGMLHLDPALVESMPCRNVRFSVKADVLIPDQSELYRNGEFRQVSGDRVTGAAYQDSPGRASFIDREVEHDGIPSLRIDNPGSSSESNGNCRLVQDVALEPFHQYRFSFWSKSSGFERASDFRVIALDAKGSNLSFQDVGLKPAEDWTQHSVVFNSQNNRSLKIYVGVWGGTGGKVWLSSLSLKDAGFLNVDRRPLCPVVIRSLSGQMLREGRDISPIFDPEFGNKPWAGEFDFSHSSPNIPLPSGSSLHEGETVTADYFAAVSTESGKTSICLSDPKTVELEQREIDRVEELFHSPAYMLCQDEMRVQGWCGACAASGKTTSQILADDIRRSVNGLKGKKAFVWSDMFDPSHNAVANYYLCNGSLAEDWKGLPPGTSIVNWNSGHAQESLNFFHHLGLGQVLAGYYDGPVEDIKPWLAKAQSIGGVEGVMYTTWVGDYRNLESFAKASWGG